MAGMIIGDDVASSGMAKDIYDVIKTEIIDNLDYRVNKDTKDKIILQNKKLAYCIAKGVINHIKSNMEIKGVKTSLDNGIRSVETYVAGVGSNGGSLATGTGPVAGSVKDSKLVSATQSNDGSGLVN